MDKRQCMMLVKLLTKLICTKSVDKSWKQLMAGCACRLHIWRMLVSLLLKQNLKGIVDATLHTIIIKSEGYMSHLNSKLHDMPSKPLAMNSMMVSVF